MKVIGYLVNDLGKIPFIESFLDGSVKRYKIKNKNSFSFIAGWGYKATAFKARDIAKQLHIPYLALEDGYLRSLSLGVNSHIRHSLIIDHSGIYYDASGISDLEKLISSSVELTEPEEKRAQKCIKLIKKYHLSKYNDNHNDISHFSISENSILVIDQTYGDASVECGMSNAITFRHMLEEAIRTYPDSQVIVKIHPDVLVGKKKGYLLELAREYNCSVLSENINPWALFEYVQQVYVVTSQLGFEALMAGKKVTCFGMPFYAGWGLTDDRRTCERRGLERSLLQVFYAAYIQYCRYINPYTGERCDLEDTIDLIAHQKAHLEKYRGNWLVFGFTKWRRSFVQSFLGLGARVSFIQKLKMSSLNDSKLLVWSSKLSKEIQLFCDNNDLALYLMEDGFLRSVGLGSEGVKPLSLIIDRTGIYYDSTRPSDLENLFSDTIFNDDLLKRAKALREQIINLRLSKYNVGDSEELSFPEGKTIILVPGQVETDASIAKGSPEIKTNTDLLKTVRCDNPEAYIIYKPHPDVLVGKRVGHVDIHDAQYYDQLISETSIIDLFDHVDEVHTMSSLSGFEALLREKEVFTYGLPFYAGWGLTSDRLQCERRKRKLSLDELVAATLILYPIYIDPASGHVCDVETALQILKESKDQSGEVSTMTRFKRKVRSTLKILAE